MAALFRGLSGGAVLVVTLCGCADPPDVGFGGTPVPDATPSPARGGPSPPPGATVLPAAQVDATALPDGHPRLVWTRHGGTVVGVYGREGGCGQVRADLVEQRATTVHVRLVEHVPTTGPCTMDLRFPPLRVRLDEPVGDRTVVLDRATTGPGAMRRGEAPAPESDVSGGS